MHFMAVEVESQRYLFLPDPEDPQSDTSRPDVRTLLPKLPPPPFVANPLHDLESAWWIVIWILFHHTDKESPTQQADAQLKFYNEVFPGRICQTPRLFFFSQNYSDTGDKAYDTLSETYNKKCYLFQGLAKVLVSYYKRLEMDLTRQPSPVLMSDSDLQAVHEQVSLVFRGSESRLKELPIQLESLTQSKKRTVDDLPTSQTRKKAKLP